LELVLLLHEEGEDDDLRDGGGPHDEQPEVEEGEGPEVAVEFAVDFDGAGGGGGCGACHFGGWWREGRRVGWSGVRM